MLGPQGRRGEVLAELHTSFPERFAERRELSALAANGTRRELQLEEHWFHKGGVVLKFAGVESISDAELLAGMELQIPQEQRAELEAGAAYVSDLVGCEVLVQLRRVGRDRHGGGCAVWGGRGSAAGGEGRAGVSGAVRRGVFEERRILSGGGLRWSCRKVCWKCSLR